MKSFSLDIGRLNEKRALLRLAAAVAALVVVLYGGYAFSSKVSAVKRLAGLKKADLEAFSGLSGEFMEKRAALDLRARKAHAPAGGLSTVAIAEEMGRKAGLGGHITSLKATGVEESLGYTAAGIDLVIEKADLNRVVNLLYMIEEGRHLFVIDEFSLKSRFDDPRLLDLRLKLRLFIKKPA